MWYQLFKMSKEVHTRIKWQKIETREEKNIVKCMSDVIEEETRGGRFGRGIFEILGGGIKICVPIWLEAVYVLILRVVYHRTKSFVQVKMRAVSHSISKLCPTQFQSCVPLSFKAVSHSISKLCPTQFQSCVPSN